MIIEKELILSRGDVAESEKTVVDWVQGLGINTKAELPEGGYGSTVLSAIADAHNSQTLYLWEEGNAPAVTKYTANNGNYADDPDFRPYLVSFPVPEGTEVKGAVLICAGGAFQFRSDEREGSPVAEELAKRGYQSFVVNYRLRPYTQEEGALDLARAVRFVRKNVEVYGIEENDIAVMGFSAGGILAGEMLLNFDGLVNGAALDSEYVPDDLDKISADAAAAGMIYSFYGRLSVGSTNVEMLRAGNLPPTFYCYGTRDPFYHQFLANADAVEEAGVRVERLQLDNRPHGFGYMENWFDAYDRFLVDVFSAE
ncbi:MAG: alpha/beta hydrolase [Lachnospiraceae bacterium]|nr:alpha/beta hydrolase [Lachnospiraceae bacterium]